MDAQALLEQAPDGQVASSATRLAGFSGWQGTGRSDTALWGLCKGSGKNPYQVCVDLGDRATKCSCPSRKFPCKHALALQLRDLREPFPVTETPDWVTEWLTRRNRAAGPAASAGSDDSPEAVERRAKAKEKTALARQNAVRAGVAGLTDWLGDVAGAGLAGLPARDAAWWHSIQARMVDAQAKGLASAVDEVRGIVAAGGPRWAHDAADRLGGLHLLARLSSSPDAVIRRRLGFSVAEEEVRAGPGWTDQWAPLLKVESDDGLVRTVRQWAWGRSHGWVVAVRHAGGGGRPVPPLTHGVQVQGVLHPYPGVPPHRVAVGELLVERRPEPVPAPSTWRAALAGLEEHLKADPWQRLHPLGCASVRVTADTRHLVDEEGRGLQVRGDLGLDQALALTGGGQFDAWGLWNGRELRLGAVAVAGGAPEVVG
ncbi:SWIM zinc finger family protein [Saccharothrix luteola]|uniref:SWIM zinc finger family protein n=1 Tax=Saccharothrix luteola TaxID=2893018 RepID=UPI001E4204A6|nr:SWIM zinc finger family protein [Saccharothrix luteola]MCC8247483.1 SWIM zinc finger domain-containing protein [Saccharothrix luteola]